MLGRIGNYEVHYGLQIIAKENLSEAHFCTKVLEFGNMANLNTPFASSTIF